MNNRLINTKVAGGGGGCTDIVDNYDPFGDSSGLALYQLNGDATDVSGNYNGTASNVTWGGTGVFGTSAAFNGSSSGIDLNHNTNYSNFTVSTWIKPNTHSSGSTIIGKWFDGTNRSFKVGYETDNRVRVLLSSDGTAGTVDSSLLSNPLTVGSWYHILVTVTENGNVILYVNNSAFTLAYNNVVFDNNQNWKVGIGHFAGEYFNGSIDQVRIFNEALTPLEVEALYTEELCICDGTVDTLDILGDGSCIATYQLDGNANDLSGNYSGTPTDVSYGVGEFDLAGVFNGSSSYISGMPSISNAGGSSSSVSVWFKSNSTPSAEEFIFGGIQEGGTDDPMFLISLNTSGHLVYAYRDTYQNDLNITDTTNYCDGNWHNVTATIDSSNMRLYINGQESNSSPNSAFSGTMTINNCVIGARNLRGTIQLYFNGEIDQVRIFNKALDQNDVDTLYAESACTYQIPNEVDLSNATLVNSNTFTIGSNGNPRGFFVSFDGTRIFTTTLDTSGNDWIEQYNLSTPFDVTTMSGVAGSKQLSAPISNYLSGVGANLDNTWITYDPYSNNEYYSQPFGTAGDITTLGTLYTDSCSRTGGDPVGACNMISKDGNYAFRLTSARNMYTNTLSINNDLSSGSGCGSVSSLSDIESSLGAIPGGFNFNDDGTQFFCFARNGKLAAYRLITAWDVSSRVNQVIYDFATDLESPNNVYAIQFNSDYTKMIVCAANSSYASYEVYEFDL